MSLAPMGVQITSLRGQEGDQPSKAMLNFDQEG